MTAQRRNFQVMLVVFILVALAIEATPVWWLILKRVDNVPQFFRTIGTDAICSFTTIALGSWLFLRVTSRLTDKLEQNEQFLRELLTSIQSPVVAFTEELVITFANASWAKMMNTEPGKVAGKRLPDVMPGWESTKLRTACGQVLETQEHCHYSVEYYGRDFDVWLWRTREGLVLFADDVTERKLVASELAEARRKEEELQAIQRTAATIAHEVNNPLAGQIALLQMMLEERHAANAGAQVNELDEMLGQVLEQSERIKHAVAALQNLSEVKYRPYVGKTEILDLRQRLTSIS